MAQHPTVRKELPVLQALQYRTRGEHPHEKVDISAALYLANELEDTHRERRP